MKPVFRRALAIAVLGIAFMGAGLHTQIQQPVITNLNLEDLMNVDVTSASKKAQKKSRVPAAIQRDCFKSKWIARSLLAVQQNRDPGSSHFSCHRESHLDAPAAHCA